MASNSSNIYGVPQEILNNINKAGLQLVYTKHKGRGLQSNSNITAGTIILQSKPFALAISPKHIHKYCNYCGIETEKLMKCSRCNFVRYCEAACQKYAWNYHKKECTYIKNNYNLFTQIFDLQSLFVLRVLDANELSKNNGKELCPELEFLESHSDRIRDLKMSKNPYDIVIKTYSPFIALRNYSINNNSLFDIHCKLSVNGHSIHNRDFEPICSGLYPEQALLNHNCRPNCINCFRGSEVLLVASRDITIGEELTINYIDIIQPVKIRLDKLKEKSYFDCNCNRCIEELEALNECQNEHLSILNLIDEAYGKGNFTQTIDLTLKIVDPCKVTKIKGNSIEILASRCCFEAYISLNEFENALKVVNNLIYWSVNYFSYYSHYVSNLLVRKADLLCKLNRKEEASQTIIEAKSLIEIIYGTKDFWYRQILELEKLI